VEIILNVDFNLIIGQERQVAWLAVGCAAMCAKALQQRALLSLSNDDTEQKIGTDAVDLLPDFMALDCAGPVALETIDDAGELLWTKDKGAHML
jgi:hypothetical protein